MRKASVGRRRTKSNYMTLDPEVTDDQSIFHELLHIVGLLHEHQRGDRNNYVKVHDDDNIAYHNLRQFQILKNAKTFGFEYDAKSIMHYSSLQGTIYPEDPSKLTISSKVFTI